MMHANCVTGLRYQLRRALLPQTDDGLVHRAQDASDAAADFDAGVGAGRSAVVSRVSEAIDTAAGCAVDPR